MKSLWMRLAVIVFSFVTVFFVNNSAYGTEATDVSRHYLRLLETLDRADSASILEARDKYIAQFSTAPKQEAAQGFLASKTLGEQVAHSLGKKVMGYRADKAPKDNPNSGLLVRRDERGFFSLSIRIS